MKKRNFNFKTKIGMRNIKTALAVTLGLYLSNIFNLDTPIFTSIACITGMKGSFSESFNDFRLRMFTAVFGVGLGYVLALIPASELIRPIIGGLGIVFIIYVLVAFDLKDMIILSCIVYIASFVYPESHVTYGINRIFGTFLGLVVALFVNFVLSVPDVKEKFNSSAITTYNSARELFFDLMFKENFDSENFEENFYNTKQLYKLLEDELHAPIHPHLKITDAKRIMKIFEELQLRFALLESFEEPVRLNDNIISLVAEEYDTTLVINGKLEGDISQLYNLSVKKILFYFESLRELLNI